MTYIAAITGESALKVVLERHSMIRVAMAFALTLLTLGSAHAQQASDFWVVAGSDADGRFIEAIFSDANRVDGRGSMKRAWFWSYFGPTHPTSPDERSTFFAEFDCADERWRVLQEASYVGSQAYEFYGPEFGELAYVIPGSTGEFMLSFVCGTASQRAANPNFYRLREMSLDEAAELLWSLDPTDTHKWGVR